MPAVPPRRSRAKFAFVSNSLPPAWSGQSVVIGRLLAPVDPASYCLITQQPAATDAEHWIAPLPGRLYQLPREAAAKWFARPGAWGVTALGCLAATVIARALRIARIARREECGAIIGATADLAGLN